MPTDPSAAAHSSAIADEAPQRLPTLMLAAALSLGSAIALGFARFAYALLLPSMKQDLGWTFAEAGAMNTANALGYLLGALAFPHLARRWRPDTLCVAGCAATALLTAASGLVADTNLLLLLRVMTGMASAAIFISGGVLAARLASARPRDAGLVLGLYYGGTGWGIVASSVLVPFTILDRAHGWQFAWFALAAACALFTVAAVGAAHRIGRLHATAPPGAQGMAASDAARWPRFAWVLAGYGLFGVGYIGYMTFIVALLRNAGMSAAVVTGFYLLLGVATVFSARLWSGLLDRMRGGQALAALNALLAIATLLPALFTQAWIAFASGALFGATFLSAVASTTAFVRHNLPASHWAKGISAFTIVFAFGQIVGPMVIGWVSDGAGLARGLIYSALLLAGGALLAVCQKPLRAD
ncbi:YbfB/YjiJ family MFS transporter [Paraburkholderia phenoliruptrix]|uniref:YbfB/YjiJ family MFS transporter n=1 Tax=Paraburkholderia phenoliruptrix TaxID=252970 RepID=UPI001C6E4898|nr:YbfB/YjiJ family MFS transporter [Paraburkholderia phenoliruptrix]MBW9107178.1 YbfB/YjiJ family MFS transporter [Paraburkholderia phenoliruptrix]MBW9132199.1 YbfB/YjiJ family MFS transporter [Paraburkholderia ginsengiterrae]